MARQQLCQQGDRAGPKTQKRVKVTEARHGQVEPLQPTHSYYFMPGGCAKRGADRLRATRVERRREANYVTRKVKYSTCQSSLKRSSRATTSPENPSAAIKFSRWPRSPEVPKKISIRPPGDKWRLAWRKNRVMAS